MCSEKAMATHSSTLAWKIPWTEETGRLQSMGSLRFRHNWATSLSLSCIGEGNGNPLQCSCLENPRDGGAWWAAVYGVAQSQIRLKQLSSSSSSSSGLWDLSSLTRDWTCAPCNGGIECKPLDCQKIPWDSFLIILCDLIGPAFSETQTTHWTLCDWINSFIYFR